MHEAAGFLFSKHNPETFGENISSSHINSNIINNLTGCDLLELLSLGNPPSLLPS